MESKKFRLAIMDSIVEARTELNETMDEMANDKDKRKTLLKYASKLNAFIEVAENLIDIKTIFHYESN